MTALETALLCLSVTSLLVGVLGAELYATKRHVKRLLQRQENQAPAAPALGR